MQADFGIDYYPDVDFRQITGGEVAAPHQGCGMVLSGENLYFSKVTIRITRYNEEKDTSHWREDSMISGRIWCVLYFLRLKCQCTLLTFQKLNSVIVHTHVS